MLLKLEEVRKRRDAYSGRIIATTQEKDKFILEIVQGGGEGPTHLQMERESKKFRFDQLTQELQQREESIRRLEAESIPNLRVILTERRKQVNASTSAVDDVAATEDKLESRRKEVSSQLDQVRDAEELLRSTMEKKRKQNDRVREKIEQLGQELAPLDVELNSVLANLSVETKRLEELDGRVKNFGELIERLDSNTTQLFDLQARATQELNEIDQSLTQAEKRRGTIGQSVEVAAKVLERATSEVALATVKKEVTDEISGDRVGHARLKKLCEEGGVPGYIGILNQVVGYPPQYAKACAAVLDRWMNAFVVDDVRSMTAMIKAGKRLNIKSFAVIPLSEVNETSSTGVEKSTGVLGPLSSVLRSDRQYRGLVNFVAGDTVLVETEAIAYVLASEGYKTVTTTGEVFELGGRAFAYGLHDMLSNILQGLEDIEDVGEVEAAVAALRAAIDRRKTMLEGLDVEARSVGKDRVKKIASVAALRAEAETVSRLSKRYRTMFRLQRQDRDNQQRTVDRLTRRQTSLTAKKLAISQELASLDAGLKEAESLELDKLLVELELARNDFTLQVNQLGSRLSEVHLSLTREKANLEQMLLPNFERVRVDLESSELKYEEDRIFVQNGRREVNELSKRLAELDLQLQKVLESSTNSQPVIEEFNTRIRRLEEERDAANRSALNTEKELFSLQQAESSTLEKVDQLLSQLHMYGYDDVLEIFEGSEQLLSQVEFEYETLGRAVNKAAERDYSAVYDNYRHLSERINELERERTSIVRFIESIDSEKNKVFMTAFETINNEFADTFKRLTGGEGRLELEDSEQIFSGGST